ncbi:MAG: di-heme oxidoredictase family protein [Pseudomonadota bacterium]
MSAVESSDLYTRDRSTAALSLILPGLNDDEQDQFILGRSFFTIPWVEAPAATTARDGLGPLFNANSCVACHRNNGGGDAVKSPGPVSRSVVMRLSSDPVYGNQIAINGIHGVPFEARVEADIEVFQVDYGDGSSEAMFKPRFELSSLQYGPVINPGRVNPRRAPSLVGLGLIETLPESEILKRVDAEDRDNDGISGRDNRVWSLEHNDWRLGRFGWKASTPSVIEQSAQALIDDLGLTNRWHPVEPCSDRQKACQEAYSSSELDVPDARLEAIAFYLTRLKTPAPVAFSAGEKIFERIGCSACHSKGMETRDGLVINPYSDFLLHDMGEDLADFDTVYRATPREWRTAPLWGIGLAKKMNPGSGFLHDGRTDTLQGAILWHGGEALPSKMRYIALSAAERDLIISFLESL